MLKKWIPLAKQRVQELAPTPATERQAGSLPQLRSIDMHVGLSLLLGDEARYRHWLSNFVDEGPNYIAQISKALAVGEPEQAALDGGEPAQSLLIRLEQAVEVLCAEIKKGLDLPDNPQAVPEPVPTALPEGRLPSRTGRISLGTAPAADAGACAKL